jgi:hypothetical protein
MGLRLHAVRQECPGRRPPHAALRSLPLRTVLQQGVPGGRIPPGARMLSVSIGE